ncbi:hypothetical protein V8C86DRAFT_1668414 [Haematococcus lacustris]
MPSAPHYNPPPSQQWGRSRHLRDRYLMGKQPLRQAGAAEPVESNKFATPHLPAPLFNNSHGHRSALASSPDAGQTRWRRAVSGLETCTAPASPAGSAPAAAALAPPSIQHLQAVTELLQQRRLQFNTSTSSADGRSVPVSVGGLMANSRSGSQQPAHPTKVGQVGGRRRPAPSPTWSVYTTSTDFAALKAGDRPTSSQGLVLGAGALAIPASLDTIILQLEEGRLSSGSKGYTRQLSSLSIRDSKAGTPTMSPLSSSPKALGAAGRVTDGGGGRQVARARATFSVLESSQEWRAKQAGLAGAERPSCSPLAPQHASRLSHVTRQGTNKSEKEEGWDLALALVPSLARDGRSSDEA